MADELRDSGAGREAERPAGEVHEDHERAGNDGLERRDRRGNPGHAEGHDRLPAMEAGAQREAEEEPEPAEEREELEYVSAQDPDRRPAFGRSR